MYKSRYYRHSHILLIFILLPHGSPLLFEGPLRHAAGAGCATDCSAGLADLTTGACVNNWQLTKQVEPLEVPIEGEGNPVKPSTKSRAVFPHTTCAKPLGLWGEINSKLLAGFINSLRTGGPHLVVMFVGL